MPPAIPILIGSLLAAGCLVGVFLNFRRKRLIDDLPTSKALGTFMGFTELKGTAEADQPLTSYLSETRCVHFSWQVEEHWSRTVTETHRDAQGRTQVRTRTESGWKKIDGDNKSIPFYLKDETGVIRIVPEGAKVHANKVFDQTVNRSDSLYFAKGPPSEISNSTHKRHFQESVIPLHAALYVTGQAREREDAVAAELAYDKNCPLFLISTRTEKQISSSYSRWFWFWLLLGLAAALGGVAGARLLGGELSPVGWPVFVLAALAYLAVFGIFWLWLTFNSLIGLHQRVRQGWSQVDVQLKRRHDLIPNLVAAVEAYGLHERGSQELIARMRRQMEATPPGTAGPDFQGLAPALRAILENYPDLKAGQNFLKLQAALVDTEHRVALARDYYNEAATFYNTRLTIVPTRYVASLARLGPRALMSAADFERAPVSVKLEPQTAID